MSKVAAFAKTQWTARPSDTKRKPAFFKHTFTHSHVVHAAIAGDASRAPWSRALDFKAVYVLMRLSL